jgi:hypothetical protein
MNRLLIGVEGQTEEEFVNEVLAAHLYECGYASVGARLLGNARQRRRRGGIRAWQSVRADLLRHLKEDSGSLVGLMVDYFAMPSTGGKEWPGRAAAQSLPTEQKADIIHLALREDLKKVAQAEGLDVNLSRFVPYVIVHEFEALLFSDCEKFANAVGHTDVTSKLLEIRKQFQTPEGINDSVDTAPSKRLLAIIPSYDKPLMGALGAIGIGLDRIREECPGFHSWLSFLEAAV